MKAIVALDTNRDRRDCSSCLRRHKKSCFVIESVKVQYSSIGQRVFTPCCYTLRICVVNDSEWFIRLAEQINRTRLSNKGVDFASAASALALALSDARPCVAECKLRRTVSIGRA